MTTTTFASGTTIESTWLNDVDALRYDSDGSDKVSFTQAGVGAATNTVQDKLRESVSVKDFGATGDGVTDGLFLSRGCIEDLRFSHAHGLADA